MMTDREVSARDRSSATGSSPTAVAGSISGRCVIDELLRNHDATPPRSALARVFGASPLSLSGRAVFRTAMGEVEVGDALDRLATDSGWHVLHSVPVDEDAEIDHLVVGPAGVYVVATAAHPDGVVEASERMFTVSDVRYPHIRNIEFEMGRVERLLTTATGQPVEVSGLLAVVEPKSLVVRETHRDVAVLPASSIVRWLSGRPTILEPQTVQAIVTVARRQSTWQYAAEQTGDPTDLRTRFDGLRVEVDRARSLKRLWATAITVAAAGAFIVVAYVILATAIGS